MPQAESYTVGWICAVRPEYVAARAFLDEEHHDGYVVAPNDNNAYTRGRIGDHNVVIATLPHGEYGISSATRVSRDMMSSFINVSIGLMVGIGGGVPSPKHDIRLGDVVVSALQDGNSGVFQYDFGKTIQNQQFKITGHLNQPPSILMTAVAVLAGRYESDGHNFDMQINKILQTRPRLSPKYSRPDSSCDRLYLPGVVHLDTNDTNCLMQCGNHVSKLVTRSQRSMHELNPAIHYGLIASGNQLMKDAHVRDKLVAERDVLCFEMEAAGLMNHFPCLVIRGICDYSDSHKNKEWQGYAAMAAAAYAKDLLGCVPTKRVDNNNETGPEKQRKQIQARKARQAPRQSVEERNKCHQLFRLTNDTHGATYEWYKERVEERVEHTCLWFLQHHNFKKWLTSNSGTLLVTADPGCGKSVLAKYLVDYALPRSSTICYFFFKDRDQDSVSQALCAIIHQLFTQQPLMIDHALPYYRMNGDKLTRATESLWLVLRSILSDQRLTPVIFVLDALDECAEWDLNNLIRNIRKQSSDATTGSTGPKYLLTCRPYEHILFRFRDQLDSFPSIRIPGEEESEAISREVDHVITYRVNQLPTKNDGNSQAGQLSPNLKRYLEKKLHSIKNRTYLWVYLVFDHLEKEGFKRTEKGIDALISTLPKSISEAYQKLLEKSKNDPMVRKVLCIILAASRPLTLVEMNIAVASGCEVKSISDLDLEEAEDFKLRLRSWCGLAVSVYQGCVFFLHQTVREFLVADISPLVLESNQQWQHSITMSQAHTVLAEACVFYLSLLNDDKETPKARRYEHVRTIVSEQVSTANSRFAMLEYCAKNWVKHFRNSYTAEDSAILPKVINIFDPNQKVFPLWYGIGCDATKANWTMSNPVLVVVSYVGVSVLVKYLLQRKINIDATDRKFNRTALSWAAEAGHTDIVKLLLSHGAFSEATDVFGSTALHWASERGHTTIVQLLLPNGRIIEYTDLNLQTPLLVSVKHNRIAVAQLLLENGAIVDAADKDGITSLRYAAGHGKYALAKLLLDSGAEPSRKNKIGETPLWDAIRSNIPSLTELLLEKGAKVNEQDNAGNTALSYAARNSAFLSAKVLLQFGADITLNGCGYLLLFEAIRAKYVTLVDTLLERGIALDGRDAAGQTPLLLAVMNTEDNYYPGIKKNTSSPNIVIRLITGGKAKQHSYPVCPSEAILRLLLQRGARTDVKDTAGNSPLSIAVLKSSKATLRLLLEHGADMEYPNGGGEALLGMATRNRDQAMVNMLRDWGAKSQSG